MLRKLTWKQFLEWRAYDRIEPIGDLRNDWHAASICSLMATVASKGKKRFAPKDFLLEFGDEKEGKKKQTWQEQKMIAQMFVAAAMSEPGKPERKKRQR